MSTAGDSDVLSDEMEKAKKPKVHSPSKGHRGKRVKAEADDADTDADADADADAVSILVKDTPERDAPGKDAKDGKGDGGDNDNKDDKDNGGDKDDVDEKVVDKVDKGKQKATDRGFPEDVDLVEDEDLKAQVSVGDPVNL